MNDDSINSARDIQKVQESNGNDSLKIIFNPGLTKQKNRREQKGRQVRLLNIFGEFL